MRIGIDASRAFINEKTGTETYSYQIIKHLLMSNEAKKHEWVLYVRSGVQSNFSNPNVCVKEIKLKYLWTQVGLAYRTWVDDLDILWIPAHTLPVLRNPNLQTVVTIHGIEYEFLPEFNNLLQRWYLPLSTKYAVNSANKIISVSEFTKKQLIERLHADPNKIKVIHEGAEDGVIFKNKKEEVLDKFKLTKQKYILFLGTVQPRKNLKRLINAFLNLAQNDLKLVIAGKLGWGYEDLPIEKLENIIFTKYVDDIQRQTLLQNALFYVQPSITEGFGLPVIEAMKYGLPVLVSNGGALPEIVPHPWPIFNPLDTMDIKNKMETLIQNPDFRLELGQRGKKWVQKFTWKNAAIETYNYLLKC